LFLDPLSGEVHDHVGGRADLAAGIVRAIGPAAVRFGEDHLRMLRAVRFAAFFGFVLEEATRDAIVRMAHRVTTVSPERIAAELRAMVSRPGRQRALELLEQTGLAREVLPELAAPGGGGHWREVTQVVGALDEPDLSTALALLAGDLPTLALRNVASRLRLSARALKTAVWLHEAGAFFAAGQPAVRPWSEVQPWLADHRAPLLADLMRARAACGLGDPAAAAWVSDQVIRPRPELDPPALVTGHDLDALGVPEGRVVGDMLAALRALQLDGVIRSRQEAVDWVRTRTRS
ncbi:MAG: hypothetical protein ACKOTB_01065, partial [Planctomycetia bacterium]